MTKLDLTEEQKKGLEIAINRYLSGELYTVVAGYAGTGKAQPNSTIIPTPNGYKTIGELKVGDYVYDRFGKPTKILGVFPQGEQEVFQITLADGRSTLCNDNHLFSYYSSRGKKSITTKSVRQMIDAGLKNSAGYKYKIPVNECIEYPEQDLKIHPYVIGAFLGDGCCLETYLTFSSETDEIPNIIAQYTDFEVKKVSEFDYNWRFYYKKNIIKYSEKANREYVCTSPKTQEFFRDYEENLCGKAQEKSIPNIYKFSSKQQRIDLLCGLFDTDGSITKAENRYNIRYSTTSLKLAKDIQEIFYSLGYSNITISKDKRKEKYTNECYSLNINIPNEDKYLFFKLKRKKDLAIEAQKYHKNKDYTKTAIIDINDLNYKTEMTCIKVDNKEELYLTNDFIVTHNTTLVKYLIEELGNITDLYTGDVCYCAYTGKATKVLEQKGNKPTSTLHRLLWDFMPRSDGKFFKKPKYRLEYKIVVIDECSMVGSEIMSELLKHTETHFIFLGDPEQLPPIMSKKEEEGGKTGFHLLQSPHIFLKEIMRQEEDSEIIRLTLNIREGKPLERYDTGEEVKILENNELTDGMLLWADQIICATNKTRIALNKRVRELKGLKGLPQHGDKIICLNNYWDDLSDNTEAPLVNGMTGELHNPYSSCLYYPSFIYPDRQVNTIQGDFWSDDGSVYTDLILDENNFTLGEFSLTPQQEYQIGRSKKKYLIPMKFSYGYAVTCWKAQGSEWNKVLVIEEGFPFNEVEHRRFLYTAATRASSKLVIIKK